MSFTNITIFGGGNAAFAASADLTLRGYRVTLCDFPEFERNIAPVAQANGEVDLIGVGRTGLATLARVTTDLEEAVAGADLIMAACQAAAHGPMARRMAPYLRDGQTILLCPGSCLGAYEVARELARAGVGARVRIAETNTFVFAARRTQVPNQARIKHVATQVFLAAIPAADTAGVVADFRELYPSVVPAADSLETCLLNLNPYIHAAPSLLNVGRVEYSRGEFFLYREGVTPSVAKVMNAVDEERVAVCRALGYRETPTQQLFHDAGYTAQLTDDLVADYQSTDVLRTAQGPFNVEYRYFTEDIGVGLAAVASLGRLLGVPMPLHDAIVAIAAVIHGVDHATASPRVVANLGLGGIGAAELKDLFVHGVGAAAPA